MVPILVFLTLAGFILVDALVVRRLASRKADTIVKERVEKAVPEVEEPQEKLFHEGHTWVEIKRATVSVGLDDFAKRFLGEVSKIDLPSPGAKIKKGTKLWTLEFGGRKLSQPAPISGRILEVNKKVLQDPNLLASEDENENWIIKILPNSLNQELHELYSESTFAKWTDLQKQRFFKEAFSDLGVVYGDGGELIPGAAKELDEEKWNQLAKKLFYSKEK